MHDHLALIKLIQLALTHPNYKPNSEENRAVDTVLKIVTAKVGN